MVDGLYQTEVETFCSGLPQGLHGLHRCDLSGAGSMAAGRTVTAGKGMLSRASSSGAPSETGSSSGGSCGRQAGEPGVPGHRAARVSTLVRIKVRLYW